jgi:heme a synthase
MRLSRFALLTAVGTLGLIGLGGLVTSHGAGMSVPDWPNTYGYNMFFFPVSKWVGGIFYEHTHRLVASSVGLLTSVLALWLYGRKSRPFMRWMGVALLCLGGVALAADPKRWSNALVLGLTGAALSGASFFWPLCAASPKWLRRLGLIAFCAVVLQGILGGLRVTEHMQQLGIFHATLAQLFFALVCSIALFTSPWWETSGARLRDMTSTVPAPSGLRPRQFGFVLGATVLILCQLALGATMRQQHAGLAIPDFPLAYGRLWPATDPASVASYNQHRMEVFAVNPITAAQIVMQMAHRLMALLILVAVGVSAFSVRRRLGPGHRLSKLTLGWLGLIFVQAFLGAATIWSNKAADIATAHVVGGALALALGTILCIISYRDSAFAQNRVRAGARDRVPSHPPMGARPAASGLH